MTEITKSNNSYLKETIALRSEIEGAFFTLGERLKRIRDEKLFESEYQNFDEFLLTAKISKATASKLIKVYETFVLEYKLPMNKLRSIGYSSLYAISGHINNKDKAEELVDRASMLTRNDLEQSLRDDGPVIKGCSHSDVRIVEVCNECDHRRRRFDLEKK